MIYLYFLGEMIIKMIAMGVMGRGCYLQVFHFSNYYNPPFPNAPVLTKNPNSNILATKRSGGGKKKNRFLMLLQIYKKIQKCNF